MAEGLYLFFSRFVSYGVFSTYFLLGSAQNAGVPFRASTASGTSSTILGNLMNIEYTINITLGGQDFTVQLDTGSSDLWVYSPDRRLNILNDSGLAADIQYGVGEDSGPIHFAELKFGEYTIPSQAFINVNHSEDNGGLIGLMGISFDNIDESLVEYTIQDAWGNETTLGFTPLSNLFAQGKTNQYYDITLGRSGDLEDWSEGTLTVGSHASGYEAIDQAPRLPVLTTAQWIVAIEGISINGKNVTLKPSSTPGLAPDGTLLALLDSGTTDAAVPEYLADAIYSAIPGSVKSDDGAWKAPCYGGANVSIFMGGQQFPVHPLDLTTVVNETYNGSTLTTCHATYLSSNIINGVAGGPDVILGDAFLRNVYASFNFGQNSTLGRQVGRGKSFVQLLSKTNTEEAWVDFIVSRISALQQTPYLIDPILQSKLPASADSDNSTESSNATSHANVAGALNAVASSSSPSPQLDSSLLNKYGPVVIGLLGANLLLMIVLCVIAVIVCTRVAIRSGAKSKNVPSNYAPVSFRDKFDGDSELQEPIRAYEDRA